MSHSGGFTSQAIHLSTATGLRVDARLLRPTAQDRAAARLPAAPGHRSCPLERPRRYAGNWLKRFDIGHEFVDYRANRVAPEILKDWAARLGGWDKLINRASTTWLRFGMKKW